MDMATACVTDDFSNDRTFESALSLFTLHCSERERSRLRRERVALSCIALLYISCVLAVETGVVGELR